MSKVKSDTRWLVVTQCALAACLFSCSAQTDANPAGADAEPSAEELSERTQFAKSQVTLVEGDASRAADKDGVEKAVERVHANGTIRHGGSIGDDYYEYIVGDMCPTGFVRTRTIATHRGNGWGGVGTSTDASAVWLAPDDQSNCRARVWTKNAGAFLYGELDWVVYMEQVGPGHYDYCRVMGPCANDRGDCDSDSECVAGLTCTMDIGAEYGWDPGIDVCTAQLPNGHPDYCRLLGPCEAGEGDCDSDAECLRGLICGRDNGADFGLESWVDACR
jgi:hypothetical protein